VDSSKYTQEAGENACALRVNVLVELPIWNGGKYLYVRWISTTINSLYAPD